VRDGCASTVGAIGRRSGLLVPLACAVRNGSRSAVELVEESLRRTGAAGNLNAVIAIREDEALADARRLDAHTRAGNDPGPLAGLPLLVKDIEDVAGMRTTFGSVLRAADPPVEHDGMAVARLRRAGAIVLGKTNVPEFAFQGFTDNELFGPTNNPWLVTASAGGSSGGSAAALAAGLAPLATATDVGGSIRIPAAACGLVGLKPTAGLVPIDLQLASPELNSHGPLTATVADARLVLGVLTDVQPGDPGIRAGWGSDGRPLPAQLLVSHRFFAGPPLPAALDRAFQIVAEALATALAISARPIEPERIFPGGYESADWFRIVGYEQARAIGRRTIDRHAANLDPAFLADMRSALGVSRSDHAAARRRARRYRRELDGLLAGDAVLVTPTLTVEGWTPDGRLVESGPVGLPSSVFNTEPANLTGHPAISVPAGRLPNGLPFGLQIVGPRFADFLLLDLAAAWEEAAPWPLVAPGYRPFADAGSFGPAAGRLSSVPRGVGGASAS